VDSNRISRGGVSLAETTPKEMTSRKKEQNECSMQLS
jgi:hypothetical protein